jgi:hypothetical protein
MLHRTKSRLAVAAAAGTVCALVAAGTAMAGPTPPWSKHNPAVPNAFTNTTPALSEIQVRGELGTFLAWKGQFDNRVQYKYRLNGTWHATKVIPGAFTNTSPSAALFATKLGKQAVLVAWKSIGKGGLSAIKYSDGVVANNGSINWTTPHVLPGGLYSETSASPALLFPANATHPRVILAYRGPFDHVRVAIGTEIGTAGRGFSWGTKKVKSVWINKSTSTETNAQPALAEILAGDTGTVYVFWTGEGKSADEPISYASTPDNVGTGLEGNASVPWTLLGAVPDSGGIKGQAQTTGSPAVASADIHGDGPLLLAYKGPSGFNIRYQTLNAGSWSQPHQFVGGNNNTTALGPALVHGTLANVSRTDARIFLHHYNLPV